jgi:hypothetical protein
MLVFHVKRMTRLIASQQLPPHFALAALSCVRGPASSRQSRDCDRGGACRYLVPWQVSHEVDETAKRLGLSMPDTPACFGATGTALW